MLADTSFTSYKLIAVGCRSCFRFRVSEVDSVLTMLSRMREEYVQVEWESTEWYLRDNLNYMWNICRDPRVHFKLNT